MGPAFSFRLYWVAPRPLTTAGPSNSLVLASAALAAALRWLCVSAACGVGAAAAAAEALLCGAAFCGLVLSAVSKRSPLGLGLGLGLGFGLGLGSLYSVYRAAAL